MLLWFVLKKYLLNEWRSEGMKAYDFHLANLLLNAWHWSLVAGIGPTQYGTALVCCVVSRVKKANVLKISERSKTAIAYWTFQIKMRDHLGEERQLAA